MKQMSDETPEHFFYVSEARKKLLVQIEDMKRQVGLYDNYINRYQLEACKHEFKMRRGLEHEGGICVLCNVNELYYLNNKHV